MKELSSDEPSSKTVSVIRCRRHCDSNGILCGSGSHFASAIHGDSKGQETVKKKWETPQEIVWWETNQNIWLKTMTLFMILIKLFTKKAILFEISLLDSWCDKIVSMILPLDFTSSYKPPLVIYKNLYVLLKKKKRRSHIWPQILLGRKEME